MITLPTFAHHPYGWEAISIFLACTIAGFVVALIAGFILLRVLPQLQFKQIAYEDAPKTHQTKTGTPTMGGICFVAALLPLLLEWHVPFALLLFALVLVCAAVGFLDDYLSIRSGKNQGLRARTKYLATALIAVLFISAAYATPALFPRDVLFHAGGFALVAPHWLWILLGILAITGTIHGVNLADGLDGLATGTMIPPIFVIGLIAMSSVLVAPAHAAFLGLGGCVAFLVFNRHPAKMFMGDTGSLALGALLAGTAILSGEMLLLLLVGGVFVAEALSVILQVTYFKLTHGKRIFKMSPLHHHFELEGWPETKVTRHFWTWSLLCSVCAIGVFTVVR